MTMRIRWLMIAGLTCLSAAGQSRVDPKLLSIHPFTGKRGSTFVATVRGSGLSGAQSVRVENSPLEIVIQGTQPEPPQESNSRNKTPIELVTIRVTVPDGAQPGRYPIRLITSNGVSNALPLYVSDLPVMEEPAGLHDSKVSAVPVTAVPTAFAGRLSRRGEADFYSFHADAGQTFTFGVISGLPQIAAGGSAATIPNFDPSLSIYEANGSWFDTSRLKRIAFNDEPEWVVGSSTDAHLVHTFAAAGDYLVRVEAFAGQGGPDYSYLLKMANGAQPPEVSKRQGGWDERKHERRLETNRLNQLAVRGGKPANLPSIETYRAGAEPSPIQLPAMIEGSLENPGETHRVRFHLDSPKDIAIEIETPSAAPPFFNPVVRLLNAAGEEVATNVFAGRGACTGALTKSLQAKTIIPLRDTGDYTVEVRDAAADLNTPEFRYRVQIRPQVPHIGQVRVQSDAVNLVPGESKIVRVMFDREEDYRGSIAIAAESLPPGVSASVGADYEPDTDPPPTLGYRERYVPRTERAVLILSANADAAPLSQPQSIHLVVRPLVDGKLGEKLMTKSLLMMVIAKP
ncbi:MAG: DVUA0089 family protein [Acidobacteriota bacterium]